MGTPEFSLPTLKKLIASKHEVIAVYTKMPKKAGRGQKIQNTPVHNFALENNLKVFTPKSLRKTEAQEELKVLKPDIIVVVAYGLILPKEVLEAPKYGCINIHPSLLPRWRGASPMPRALLAGDKKTGVCIVEMGEGLDDGDVIKCEEIEITEKTDIKYLHDTLSVLGAKLMIETLDEIEASGKVSGKPQDDSLTTYAKKIEKSEGKIDWSKTMDEIDRQIRALWAYPGVWFDWKGERIKVLKAEKVKWDDLQNRPGDTTPGKTIDDKFTIACADGAIRPLILQREGKKPMKIEEFLRGFEIN